MIHSFKDYYGLAPNDNLVFHDSGDVFFGGSLLGISMTSRPSCTTLQDGNRLAYASCSISGDNLDPDFWTRYFGREPDIKVIKGKPFVTPWVRMSSGPGRTGVWGCSSRKAIHDNSLYPHIAYLIDTLGLPRPNIANLIEQMGQKMRVLCYWSNYEGDRIPRVSESLRSILATCGAVLEIDQYPQSHKFLDRDGEEHDISV
jgi:hypothetical protein